MKDSSTITTTITSNDLSSPFIRHLNQNIVKNEKNNDILIKWSTKEKLFLIAFTMINGDSNWSYVSEQLNDWMSITSTYNYDSKSRSDMVQRTPMVTIFIHIIEFEFIYSYFLSSKKQCSKQYKVIVKHFILKNGFCDLKYDMIYYLIISFSFVNLFNL
jgi:hypothetical protein